MTMLDGPSCASCSRPAALLTDRFCELCGRPFDARDQNAAPASARAAVTFTGSGLHVFNPGGLAAIFTIGFGLVIQVLTAVSGIELLSMLGIVAYSFCAASAMTLFYRWLFRHIVLPTATKLSFAGDIGELAGIMSVVGIGSHLWWVLGYKMLEANLDRIPNELPVIALYLPWSLPTWILAAAWAYAYWRWICQSVRFSSDERLAFQGKFWSFAGWYLLTLLAIFSVVGAPWAAVAFLRWLLRNTTSTVHRLAFNGRGLDLLWQGLLVSVASIAIVPIPWVVTWWCRWLIGNIEAERISTPKMPSPLDSPMAR